MAHNMRYRAELDGVRAVAVLAVVFYHAKLSLLGYELFKGGFFGVDIFFVLSGFLITSIIFSDLAKNHFSIRDFFLRRAKRILPALILVLLISSFFAYIFLLPDNLAVYAKTLLSSLFFISNFYFFGEDTYISDSSDYKPLLHTWSLSVEWQFYIIFPFLCIIAFKHFKHKKLKFVIFLLVSSLLLAQFLSSWQPNFSFYLLPTRMWELLAGSAVAILLMDCKDNLNKIYYKVMPSVGLLLILFSILFVDDKVLHPSIITVLPILGTCIVIYFSRQRDIATSLLSLKPVIFIGAISYSIYLWHQPLFVFYRVKMGSINVQVSIVLILLCVALAIASFYLIEKPFRKRHLAAWKWAVMSISMLILTIFAGLAIFKNGFSDSASERLSPLAIKRYEDFKTPEFRRLESATEGRNYLSGNATPLCINRDPSDACRFGDESWVVIGDSYAGSFEYALQTELAARGKGIISLTYEQCSFVSDNLWFGTAPECAEINRRRWNVIKAFTDKKTFLISANYAQFKDTKMVDNPSHSIGSVLTASNVLVWTSLADNINKLLSMGHRVVLVYPIPTVRTDVKREYFRLLNVSNGNVGKVYDKSTKGYNAAISLSEKLDTYIKPNPNLIIINPVDSLCEGHSCLIINKSGGLYNQGSHLSNAGAKLVLGRIIFEEPKTDPH
ncbi:TPA: acyltransferase family protein [Yersinia enterocolitica]|uniref:acyltransferase family protein n=3 Tax=Yersinia enterocolitica TaxID=630 RepID=UPI0005025319|nr:acyltransferase family protein [Yersinia enterocolitica]AJJ28019.1 acyltransferase family protein [Yersinia enterocolitica]ALG77205.1 acyltransferase [Yersinia enterocolitica]KGA55829.1 acyltransferase family protein [Yersinia enterocolitica]MDA5485933.1 acyltransferase family protein [Yersinia enterocolitica]NGN38639.1 acyltransferase [Yersinia enterocolitica subsp. palearctica]